MMTTFLIEKSTAVHEPRDSFSGYWELFPLGLIPLARHQVRVFLGLHASSWTVEIILAWTLAARPTVLSEGVTQSESHRKLLPHFVDFHCVG